MIQKDPERRPAAIEVADRLAAMTARLGSMFRGDAVAVELRLPDCRELGVVLRRRIPAELLGQGVDASRGLGLLRA